MRHSDAELARTLRQRRWELSRMRHRVLDEWIELDAAYVNAALNHCSDLEYRSAEQAANTKWQQLMSIDYEWIKLDFLIAAYKAGESITHAKLRYVDGMEYPGVDR